MTEDEIEIKAEKMMDRLDKSFMAGKISEEEYRKSVRDIDNWVRSQSLTNE
jgi:uncharacterized membrane protein